MKPSPQCPQSKCLTNYYISHCDKSFEHILTNMFKSSLCIQIFKCIFFFIYFSVVSSCHEMLGSNNVNESIFPKTFKIFIKLKIIYKHSNRFWGFKKNQIVFTNLICCYSFKSCSIEIREKMMMYKSFMILLCAQRALISFNVMKNSNKNWIEKNVSMMWLNLLLFIKMNVDNFPIGYQKIKTNIYNLKI